MEYRVSDSRDNSILRYKLKSKQDRSYPFYQKCAFQYPNDKFDHSGKCVQSVSLLDRDPSLHRDPFPQHQIERRDTCYDPKTSDLDQDHKDDLSHHGKLLRRDDRHEPGHAHAGHRRKERVDKFNRLLVAERKPQEHAA